MSRAIPHVVVAGGGVTALEVLLRLRRIAPDGLHVTLLAPEDRFHCPPLSAYPGLLPDTGPVVSLSTFVAEHGAGLIADRAAAVAPALAEVRTSHGGLVGYDALVVAVGSSREPVLTGAITLGHPADRGRMAETVARVRAGDPTRVAIVVPLGVRWSLPAYELALLLQHAAPAGNARITVITAERGPMATFGAELSVTITTLLHDRGIAVVGSSEPAEVDDGRLWAPRSGAVPVDAVIALPRPRGRALSGLPHDEDGFLETDAHGRVLGLGGIWAAGNGARSAVEQEGMAVQQATVVAHDVAHRLGAAPRPETPAPPIIRATLLDGEGTLYLATEATAGGWRTRTSHEPLWSTPSTITSGLLGAYLDPLVLS